MTPATGPMGVLLGVTRADARVIPAWGHGASNDPALDGVRQELLAHGRLARRCAFCNYAFGPGSAADAHVHHRNGDHSDFTLSNVALTCFLCHVVHHCDHIGRAFAEDDMGKMIFLPEMRQEDLHVTVYAIAFRIATLEVAPVVREPQGAPPPGDAHPHTMYQRLLSRVSGVEGNGVTPGLSDPRVMGRLLQTMSAPAYAERGRMLAGVRYLPPLFPLVERVREWSRLGGAFAQLDSASWPDLVRPRSH